MDGAESVRSGRSDRSERSHRSHNSNHHHHQHQQPPRSHHPSHHSHHHHPQQVNQAPSTHPAHHGGSSSSSGRHHHHHGHGRHGNNSGRDRHERDRDRDDRSVTIKMPGQGSSELDSRTMEERIEVQVLPQDDNWGDNTTAMTGNTSETGMSMEDVSATYPFPKEFSPGAGFNCVRFVGTAVAVILSLFGFLSPVAMVVLPHLDVMDWTRHHDGSPVTVDVKTCLPECEGLLISFAFKLLILMLGTLAVFFRQPKATMPRVFVFRAVVLFLVFVLTFAFWLFYGVRIVREKRTSYHGVVQFADSLVDGLLFLHYLALLLLEIRQIQPQFVVRVTRSPDGETACYSLGALSVQRAAVAVLEHYHRDFPAYNPYLDTAGRRPGKQQSLAGFKVYEVDGHGPNQSATQGRSRAVFAAAARRRDSGHNDRFYDEQEYERRVRKRRARLVVAAEEAFTHIKRLQEEQGPAIPMDPQEAAQAVFPSMARALQKYLRITRQQPRYSMESVLTHLATSIAHDLAPRAFIARYLTQGAVIMSERDCRPVERWVLVCDHNVVREVEDAMEFQLRHGDVSLMCFVRKLPHFSVTEEVIDPKNNKFVLRLNSETSV